MAGDLFKSTHKFNRIYRICSILFVLLYVTSATVNANNKALKTKRFVKRVVLNAVEDDNKDEEKDIETLTAASLKTTALNLTSLAENKTILTPVTTEPLLNLTALKNETLSFLNDTINNSNNNTEQNQLKQSNVASVLEKGKSLLNQTDNNSTLWNKTSEMLGGAMNETKNLLANAVDKANDTAQEVVNKTMEKVEQVKDKVVNLVSNETIEKVNNATTSNSTNESSKTNELQSAKKTESIEIKKDEKKTEDEETIQTTDEKNSAEKNKDKLDQEEGVEKAGQDVNMEEDKDTNNHEADANKQQEQQPAVPRDDAEILRKMPAQPIRFDDDDSPSFGFLSYFIMATVFTIMGYIAYHNKSKILGLVFEGRPKRRYQRLSTRQHDP